MLKAVQGLCEKERAHTMERGVHYDAQTWTQDVFRSLFRGQSETIGKHNARKLGDALNLAQNSLSMCRLKKPKGENQWAFCVDESHLC